MHNGNPVSVIFRLDFLEDCLKIFNNMSFVHITRRKHVRDATFKLDLFKSLPARLRQLFD